MSDNYPPGPMPRVPGSPTFDDRQDGDAMTPIDDSSPEKGAQSFRSGAIYDYYRAEAEAEETLFDALQSIEKSLRGQGYLFPYVIMVNNMGVDPSVDIMNYEGLTLHVGSVIKSSDSVWRAADSLKMLHYLPPEVEKPDGMEH